ncbi:hypothetical protein ABIA41_004840 [Bradyrhizobium sp. USDA 313]
MSFRALSARRRQAAAAGLGRDCRRLQDRRWPFRSLPHQFPASPRRRLRGARLRGGAREGAGGIDAMEGGGFRNRGLRSRRRCRADAVLRRMVRLAAGACARAIAAGLDRENRRGAAEAVANRRSPALRSSCARSLPRHRGPRRRPHARRARRGRAAGVRAGAARDSLAQHRYRPRQAYHLHRAEERSRGGSSCASC